MGDAKTGNAARREILRAYLAVTQERLERAARVKGVDVSDCVPAADAIQATLGTDNVETEAFSAVVSQLRTGYQRLGMAFPEPMTNP